jgi:uncharacterized protein with HEPN domain
MFCNQLMKLIVIMISDDLIWSILINNLPQLKEEIKKLLKQ